MEIKVARKVFTKGTASKNVTVRMTEEMNDKLEKAAEYYGVNKSQYIVDILDQVLQVEAEAGNIDWPKGYKVSR